KLCRPLRRCAVGRACNARHRHMSAWRQLRSPAEPNDDGRRHSARHLQCGRLPSSCSHATPGRSRYAAVTCRLAGRRLRPASPRGRSGMTPIRMSLSSLREGRWYEYIIPFALGGAATVFAGLVGSRYGASIGGLFLALPAIFCASATLIEKHEIRRKRKAGLTGERRGQQAAALDAAGAALGAVGLLTFALVFSLLVKSNVLVAFSGGSFAWLIVSVAAWHVSNRFRGMRRMRTAEKSSGSTNSRSRGC